MSQQGLQYVITSAAFGIVLGFTIVGAVAAYTMWFYLLPRRNRIMMTAFAVLLFVEGAFVVLAAPWPRILELLPIGAVTMAITCFTVMGLAGQLMKVMLSERAAPKSP